METEHLNSEIPTLFLVCHEHDQIDKINTDLKIIGIFQSREMANEVINDLKDKIGFRDSPEGFSIDAYRLGTVFWSEGFV